MGKPFRKFAKKADERETTGADIEIVGSIARGERTGLGDYDENDPRRAFGWSPVTDVVELRRRYDDLLLRFSQQAKELSEAQDLLAQQQRELAELLKKNTENLRECDILREDRTELEGQVRDLIETCGALARSYNAVA